MFIMKKLNDAIEDNFMNVKEASCFLKVKVSTLYSWIHQRKIPYRKHGSRVIFLQSELKSWSDNQIVEKIYFKK